MADLNVIQPPPVGEVKIALDTSKTFTTTDIRQAVAYGIPFHTTHLAL